MAPARPPRTPAPTGSVRSLIDDWGRTPQPYQTGGEWVYPTAYQQILSRNSFFHGIAPMLGAYGQRYEEILPIRGANGRGEDVKFGFIKDWSGVVRLTTAYAGTK